MPDISMCQGRGCEKRNDCYRHRAKPSEYRQSWAAFDEQPKPCKQFMTIFGWDKERCRAPSPEPGDDDAN